MSSHLIDLFKPFIPKLVNSLHKGQAGRIAVLGGSKEYTGAPYFSAITAMRMGSDICHIFATTEGGTATALKTMDPDLIVHPIEKNDPSDIIPWLLSLHCIVIGPGLGRTVGAWNCAKEVMKAARNINLPMVLDGDILRLLCVNKGLDIIQGYDKVILTPNVVEYNQLSNAIKEITGDSSASLLTPQQISTQLGNVTIVQKGQTDHITDGNQTVSCDEPGMPRRCGGQGDFLAGAVAAMYTWANLYYKYNLNESPKDQAYPLELLSSYAACTFLRRCSSAAFSKHKRSTITKDILKQIPNQFELLFPDEDSQ
ncbi:hypothetical protein DLAC_00279 [Tieghemostelium lacteum]|uniref:ATP-dependent (S)-NAD(P)H-hydrate dehydratase n=1 Tax=Tieghemostelium lacteum TaxID=361077 RepID=A0A152A9B2_TIELA|nr:hypothetical protein DLAC_00279 [Tieghemostelium lacteum]|eukprot:KYR02813.1 hypothetical protein DLAC_00279 [Tieghemostelium lacteum]